MMTRTEARHRHGEHRANAWLTPLAFVAEIRAAFGGTVDLDPVHGATHPRERVGSTRLAGTGL